MDAFLVTETSRQLALSMISVFGICKLVVVGMLGTSRLSSTTTIHTSALDGRRDGR
jgi:uncharacterized membrane protein